MVSSRDTHLAKQPVRNMPIKPPPAWIRNTKRGSFRISLGEIALFKKDIEMEERTPMTPELQTGTFLQSANV
jgi:hypothetical protein